MKSFIRADPGAQSLVQADQHLAKVPAGQNTPQRLGAAREIVENVGGTIIEAVLPLLSQGARIPVCGFIAHYNRDLPPAGQDRLAMLYDVMIGRGVTARGFLVNEFEDLRSQFETLRQRHRRWRSLSCKRTKLVGLCSCA